MISLSLSLVLSLYHSLTLTLYPSLKASPAGAREAAAHIRADGERSTPVESGRAQQVRKEKKSRKGKKRQPVSEPAGRPVQKADTPEIINIRTQSACEREAGVSCNCPAGGGSAMNDRTVEDWRMDGDRRAGAGAVR